MPDRYDEEGRRKVAVCIVVNADMQYLLITSRSHPDEWIVPKGGWEEGETAEEAAERETFEESGIIAKAQGELVLDRSLCVNEKSLHYAMKLAFVRECAEWPESAERSRKWVSHDEAMRVVKRPLLRAAIHVAGEASSARAE